MSYHQSIDGPSLPSDLLEREQLDQLNALVATLTPAQALWISGYLAGLGSGAVPAQDTAAPQAADGPRVTVLYGTETGNAQGIAERLAARLSGKGVQARAVDMADYRTRELRDETHVILVSATHGEGDPPEPAAGFFEFLWSRKAPSLTGVKFAVLALGDSSYVHYCKAGRDLDRRFEELGAERLLDRVDCDVDYEAPADAWIEALSSALESIGEAAPGRAAPATTAGPAGVMNGLGLLGRGFEAPAASKPSHSRSNPYAAEILKSIRLNGRYSDKDTRHIELAVEDGALTFEPGDSLAIVPENDERTVAAVLETTGLPGDAPVRVGEADKPLRQALTRDLELTLLTPAFLEAYAEAAGADGLKALLGEENRDTLRAYLAENQVPDVLAAYPAHGLSAQDLVAMLRQLQPRLYSIASSRAAAADEVHLTVGVTRFTKGGKPRDGAASTYLSDRRAPGERVQVYVQPNKSFRLPADPEAPIIMIGPGTGVAPFRAFVQEREEMGARGKSWLFFGERTMREDFLYQREWLQMLKDGSLSRMDVAFSRDGAQKVYVQDRLRERARDVYAWLEEGAHLYVCGDAEGMAPGVHEALLDIVRNEGDLSDDDAQAYLKRLRDEKRYQRDVY